MSTLPPISPAAPPRAFRIDDVPGFAEALANAREKEFTTRADAWWNLTFDVAGFPLRTMTLQDYEILLRERCPILLRDLPQPEELVLLLWWLSPAFARWNTGWRDWFSVGRRLTRWFYLRRCRRQLKLADLCRRKVEWELKNTGQPFEVPDDSPFAQTVAAVFEYRDQIFYDQPPQMKASGEASGLSHLTTWFCHLQREFHLPTAEIEQMPLPQLFARLKELQAFHNPRAPHFNARRDDLYRQVQQALATGMNVTDLFGGAFKFN